MYINKSLINYLFNVGKISLYGFIKRKFEMSFIKQFNIFKKTENSLKKIFNFYIIILLSNVYVHEKCFIKRTKSTTKKSPVVIAQSKTYPVSTYLLIISNRKFIILIIIK